MTEDLQKIKDKLKRKRFAGQTFIRPGRQDLVVYYASNSDADCVYLKTSGRTEFEQEEQMDFTPEEIEKIAEFVKTAKKAANANRRADAKNGEEG